MQSIQAQADNRQRNATREYEALKHALIAAGTPIESIQVLIDASSAPAPLYTDDESCSEASQLDEICIRALRREHTKVWTRSLKSQTTRADGKWTTSSEPNLLTPVMTEDICKGDELEASMHAKDRFAAGHEERSLTLKGLPITTTLLDVTKVIRGGLLMNAFLRSTYRMAYIAFVEPAAARQFFKHVKQNDLYIRGKRVCGSGFGASVAC